MILSMLILIAASIAIRDHWNRLAEENRSWQLLFWRWLQQGFMIPVAAWGLINFGLSERFPALVPTIAHAQAHDQVWWNLWIQAVIEGTVFIGLGWAAITYTWLMVIIVRRVPNTPEFRTTVLTVGIPMLCLALIIVNRSHWTMLPVGLITVFLPLVHCTMHQAEKPPPVPSYSRAIGQMNFGKYEDAEMEVINQLEKKENDFQGWLMLAELYATKYRRFDDAAQVVVDLCNDPSIQPVEISVACNKLADWQLELAQNPAAARAALDLLMQRAPGTHFARMAQQRLQQLPRTREDLIDQKKPRAIRLPSLREHFEESQAADQAANKREATLEANRLTARLQDNPNDHEVRERLALLLAERLGHIKLGAEQLRLIIKQDDVPAECRAKCLSHLANWERRFNKNETGFKNILNEILRDFPNTTQAYSARRQLQLMENEALEKANPAPVPVTPIRIKVPDA